MKFVGKISILLQTEVIICIIVTKPGNFVNHELFTK